MGRHINLFQYEDYFTLTIDGVAHAIKEPVGFDKSDIEIKRDEKYYGVNYSMIQDSSRLSFDLHSGYLLIEDHYNRFGSDAVIQFDWSYVKEGVVYPQYSGNLNLNTYEIDVDFISCSVEKVTFDSLFRTRYDTKVDLNAFKTLDGAAIEKLEPLPVSLHSKGLAKKFESNTTEPGSYTHKTARFLSIQMDTTEQTVTEIDDVFSMPLDMSGIDPVDAERYFFDVLEQGSYSFNSTASFNFVVGAVGLSIGDWVMVPRIIVLSGGVRRETLINAYKKTGYVQGQILRTDIAFSFNITLNLLPGDKVYYDVFAQMGHAGRQYNYNVSNYLCKIELFAQTLAPASTGYVYRYFDALNKALEVATGKKDILRSSYFSPGGCGYRHSITNGYQLRNFEIATRPVQVSLKELIEGMKPIVNLGIGFSRENGVDVLVVEPMESFYTDKVISHVENHYEYKEATAKELIHNEIEVGYNKFPEDELLSLDEFNTYHKYLTPAKSIKSNLEIRSDFIASGYEIEKCRREQFSAKPNTSLANDDEIFIIVLNDFGTAAERSEAFDSVTGLYSPDTVYNLRITPKRMLFNWGRYINSGLFYKGKEELIQNTFTKNNGELTSQMKYTDSRSMNEPDGATGMVGGFEVTTKAPVKEKDHIKIGDLQKGERLWVPTWVTFKADMKWDEMYAIVDALNRTDHENSYGYITFRDKNNLLQGGYPYTFTYNPKEETCTIKCLKKLLTLPNGVIVSGSCDDYANWTFDQFENNVFDEPIEDCTFDNFI